VVVLDTNVSSGGTISVTLMLVAVLGPALDTIMVYSMISLMLANGESTDLVSERSAVRTVTFAEASLSVELVSCWKEGETNTELVKLLVEFIVPVMVSVSVSPG